MKRTCRQRSNNSTGASIEDIKDYENSAMMISMVMMIVMIIMTKLMKYGNIDENKLLFEYIFLLMGFADCMSRFQTYMPGGSMNKK